MDIGFTGIGQIKNEIKAHKIVIAGENFEK